MIAGTTILGNFHLLVVLVALHLACAEVETHIIPVITLAPLLCVYIYT